MPINDSPQQTQAQRILDAIAFTPFEQCQPLSHEFGSIPTLLLELEAIILRATEPPYNVQISTER